MQTTKIRLLLKNAVQRLLRDDYFLLEYDVHEQAIAHRIAVYLEPVYSEHHVDCEYNNDLDSETGRKRVRYPAQMEETDVRPDIVVHHRGLNGPNHNILIVELKKLPGTQEELNTDRKKLCEFTAWGQQRHFGYRCGALVMLGVKDHAGEIRIEWFENGSQVGDAM